MWYGLLLWRQEGQSSYQLDGSVSTMIVHQGKTFFFLLLSKKKQNICTDEICFTRLSVMLSCMLLVRFVEK